MEELGTLESRAFWRDVRDVAPLIAARATPSSGRSPARRPKVPAIVARIKAQRPSAEASTTGQAA